MENSSVECGVWNLELSAVISCRFFQLQILGTLGTPNFSLPLLRNSGTEQLECGVWSVEFGIVGSDFMQILSTPNSRHSEL